VDQRIDAQASKLIAVVSVAQREQQSREAVQPVLHRGVMARQGATDASVRKLISQHQHQQQDPTRSCAGGCCAAASRAQHTDSHVSHSSLSSDSPTLIIQQRMGQVKKQHQAAHLQRGSSHGH
jgi:hypothetical protein